MGSSPLIKYVQIRNGVRLHLDSWLNKYAGNGERRQCEVFEKSIRILAKQLKGYIVRSSDLFQEFYKNFLRLAL